MSGRGVLRAIRFAPLVAALLLAAVWFSVPRPLAVKMLAMAAAAVPVGDPDDPFPSRSSLAKDYFEAADFEHASKKMADVRLRDVARKTWMRLSEHLTSEVPTAPIHPKDSGLRLLREFAKEFPDARVDAFIVPPPAIPSVIHSLAADPDSLPRDPFKVAWGFESEGSRDVFDPRRWDDEWTVSEANARAIWQIEGKRRESILGGAPAVYADAFWFGPDAYRVYMFDPLSDAERDGFRHKRSTLLRGSEARVNDQTCGMCHSRSARQNRFADPRTILLRRPQVTFGDPTAMFIGGPVRFAPRLVYSTREASAAAADVPTFLSIGLQTAETTAFPMDSAELRRSGVQEARTLPGDEGRWMSFVWAGRSDWHIDGQTMFFVATYSKDPHGAYLEWRETVEAKAFTAIRLWLALQLPWLLAMTGTLLAVSLVASPVAFAVERRLATREQLQAELGRVQRDAHDRVYNRLTALAKRVDDAADTDGDVAHLGAVAEDIRATVGDLQVILGEGEGTRERTIDGASLPVQLRAVASAQGPRHGIEVRFETSGDPGSLPARLGWDLQCVLEEAVTNAARHGEAGVVTVRLSSERDRLVLQVIDDGRGLGHSEGTGTRRSTGLTGMRERLGRWGGSVDLDSRAGGAELVAQVPLPPKRERAL